MATYTAIPDGNIDPDSPVRSVDGLALRDNPIAIAEGASGAPRVATAALKAPIAGTGNLIRRIQEAEVTTLSSTYPDPDLHDRYSHEQHVGCSVLVPGTITAYVEHRATTANNAAVRVLKNGSVVQTWQTTSTSFVARQQDISVTTGDVIIFQQVALTANSEWRNIRIYSGNPDMAVT